MKEYNFGEIVLIEFPFTDTIALKRRPALILLDNGDNDIIVARVTSQVTQASFDVEITDWKQAGLLLPSIVRVDKVATLEKRLAEKKLGKLATYDYTQVLECIKHLCALIS